MTRTIDSEVSLAPDGTRIAFISNRDGRFKLYVMNIDGSGLRRLTDDAAADDNPAWSPDGRWIAFATERSGDADIHIIAADRSSRRRVTHARGNDIHPAWSPDGRALVFTTSRNSRSPDRPQLDIYRIEADGRNERQLTSGPVTSFASWSPDGRHMIYWRMFGDNADIALADREGNFLRRLTNDPAFEGWPSWSPDGTRIAFARERGEEADIMVTDLAGNVVLVAGGPGRKTGPRWSADGRHIYYSRQVERQVRIWRVPSPSSTPLAGG